MSAIAGHTFDGFGVCDCGRRWRDMAHVDDSYAGELGYAHSGPLYPFQITQIKEARAAELARFEEALRT